jgi:uncharacterized protein
MNTAPFPPQSMSEEDFTKLEEVLVSELVPEDCMDLEMLDGFLVAVLLSPQPLARERWLPAIWSAHGEEDFNGEQDMQNAIRLVLAYYNELATTLGLDEGECWEPFCFAQTEDDELGLGEEWADGFAQGLELWPESWQANLPMDTVEAVQRQLEKLLAPWDARQIADEDTRLGWLRAAGVLANDIFARWRDLELPAPLPIIFDMPQPEGRTK